MKYVLLGIVGIVEGMWIAGADVYIVARGVVDETALERKRCALAPTLLELHCFSFRRLSRSVAVDLCDPHNEQDVLLDAIISMSK
jgi:hypothetical protein